MEQLWAGIDIGGTKTAVLLSADPPAVLCRREFPTQPECGPEPALQLMREILREFLSERQASLRAIGVSCGSPLDRVAGVIQAPPNLPTWKDVPIKSILEAEFGCVCRLENDANAGAVAEHRFGAGQGVQSLVFLTMGTGLGGGIIADGRLYHGACDSAGEIGHVRLTRTGPEGYHKEGSVEGWSSGGGIAQLARKQIALAARRQQSTLLAIRGDAVSARDVAEAAARDDAVAKRVLRDAGTKLGETLAILVDVLNPERIVIGGIAMRLGEAILGPARVALQREALAPSVAACEIVPAALGERIGDVAALCVAMGF